MQAVRHGFLGGLSAGDFLARYWQRKPLLIRNAFPGFSDPIDPRGVLALAVSQDAQSRLVRRRAGRWSLEHGPFEPAALKQLPSRDWTVLVSDTNLLSDSAAQLLQRFDFVPQARVDDLMVSYAVPGGGVGPHVDSYDVFLLQGHGRRRWEISQQKDHTFREGLPLKILERFESSEAWVLEAGDMLYLPPGVAHHGIAETECLTWSVGFRAPTDAEWASAFLDFLHERLTLKGQYRDPGLKAPRHAGEVPAAMVAHAARALGRIRWSEADVREFAGRYLSEPKPHVVMEPPRRPMPRARFEAQGARTGLALDRRARLLFSGSIFHMNGESVRVSGAAAQPLRALADNKRLVAPLAAPERFWELAYEWYLEGALHLQRKDRP